MIDQLPDFPEITPLQSSVDKVTGYRDALSSRLGALVIELKNLRREEVSVGKVLKLFQAMIDRELSEDVRFVEQLLTDGLQSVFDDQELEVQGEVSVSRGKVSLSLLTVQQQPDGTETRAVSTSAFGGSVTTVESILLRLLLMLNRGLRPMLLLDESLAAFDAEYATNAGKFLRSLCKRLGVDMLVITHDSALFDQAQTRYEIRRGKAGAKFIEIEAPGENGG